MTTAALVDPERQFLGCLMQQPASEAGRLVDGLGPGDFADPMCAWVFALALGVLGDGRAPSPVALLEHARDTTNTAARTGGADLLARLGGWLVDTYRDTPHANPEHGTWLKTVVLKQAWRRAVAEHTTRVLQATEQCPTNELRRLHTDTAHTERLWRRYHAATHPTTITEAA